jgi:tetratricopeptide (TPR) repeat protein
MQAPPTPTRGRRTRARRVLASVLLVVAAMAGCAREILPPVVTTPRYPEFIFPELTSSDLEPGAPAPRYSNQAELVKLHDGAWRWFQSGDLVRAEREFQAVLKRSPAFYPTQAALGYLEFARKNYERAVEHFDRALMTHATYVPALVGRGESLLALSREPEALAAFESAVKLDPSLTEIGRRVEVLRARAAQENVAAARRAAQAGRLDEASRAYEQAIADSPDSAFLIRDLADVELRQGKTDQALARYRSALQLDPADVPSRMRIAEVLDARGDLEGALALYTEAYALEPNSEIRRRINALEAQLAYLRLPVEYRAIPSEPSITRGDLAALIGIRLETLLNSVPAQPVVITDTRDHWAMSWINAAAQAGVMDPYDNHTFQPRDAIRRSDLAQAVSRLLKIIAGGQPTLLKDWQSRQQKMTDVGVSNLNYADVSLSVASGILPLDEGGLFQLSRPVTGPEAIDAVTRLERLHNASQ